MSLPCGEKKFPELFLPTQPGPELIPPRSYEGRGEILPNLLKPRFSQDLRGIIETIFLSAALQDLFKLFPAQCFVP